MNNEIKEILDSITNNVEDYYIGTNGCLYQDLTKEQLLLIKNYIANLQEKVDQYENPNDLTLFYMWLDEKAKDKLKQLENEVLMLKQQNQMITQLGEDYKSRNEKAIVRIKLLGKFNGKYCTRNFKMMSADFNYLLNILQGSDKE